MVTKATRPSVLQVARLVGNHAPTDSPAHRLGREAVRHAAAGNEAAACDTLRALLNLPTDVPSGLTADSLSALKGLLLPYWTVFDLDSGEVLMFRAASAEHAQDRAIALWESEGVQHGTLHVERTPIG